MIRTYVFQPEIKIFGIDPEQCSPRIKKSLQMIMDEYRENITVEAIADP
ncbi:MAG: hypothetical protein ACREOO_05430 [bacterium]